MWWTIPLVVLTLLAGVARAEDPGFGEPIVALTEERSGDPAPVDTFVFALYADGHVIYQPARGDAFLIATLSPSRQRALLDGLRLDELARNPPVVPLVLDGVAQCIVIHDAHANGRACWLGGIDPAWGFKPPAALYAAWHRLRSFVSFPATRWLPTQVDVKLRAGTVDCPASPWRSSWPKVPTGNLPKQVVLDARYLRDPQPSSNGCNRQAILETGEIVALVPLPAWPTLPAR